MCFQQSVTSRLETSRYRDFSQFFESIGLGLENFGLEKRSRYRSRKYLVSKKVSVSVSKIFGLEKSLGIGLENFGLKKSLSISLENFGLKKSLSNELKKFVLEKVVVLVSVKKSLSNDLKNNFWGLCQNYYNFT